ncbi:hypothetical protein TTHT_1179 [Thermotomaculum hydrothermale]|uniref:Uncharacterized protein n=1 Tax=Thermotomaculum hydrothermale TaxID=981385 RepID=A0A7R6PHI5_9BACT|nr:hypothetical protein [Thermotomaculum hydrothermale]BBB32709.1 hypothetical protein TTHT_1179 [Thermotomaculum hydrothermale]
MGKKFVEMVFDCPFILLKGFLRGLISCKDEEVEYFFPKLAGIEAETLKETLKEWLGLESHVHLCIEKKFADYLQTALEKNYERLKVKVVSKREIEKAYFDFKFAFFEEKALNEFRKKIENAVKGCEGCNVKIEKSEGFEPLSDDFGGGLAPVVPAKRYFLEGRIEGYLPSVVKMRDFMVNERIGDISKIKLVLKD